MCKLEIWLFPLKLQGKVVKRVKEDRVVGMGFKNVSLKKSLYYLLELKCSILFLEGIIWNLWVLSKVVFFS